MSNLAAKKVVLYSENPFNIHYLTDFHGTSGYLIILNQKTILATDKRYLFEAQKHLASEKIKVIESHTDQRELLSLIKKNRLPEFHIESDLSYEKFKRLKKLLKKNFPKLIIRAVKSPIEIQRRQKTSDEISKIRAAQKIADEVFKKIKRYLKPGIKENKIAWIIEKIGRDCGAENVSFPPLVCFGENSAVPHHHPASRSLAKKTIILLDFGFKYQGYCSDMTRMLFKGTPSNFQQKIYQTVLHAQKNAINNIKPQMTSREADKLARSLIEKTGYGGNFLHSLGHGVGLEIHEYPSLSAKVQKNSILKENMVITVEPGIYLDKKFGVRIEDLIVIKSGRNQNLTKSPKELSDSII